MSTPRKDEQAAEMYALYQAGKSLSQVAKVYGVSRQSVFELLKNRGFAFRPKKEPKPFILFNGAKYTLRNTGYFGKTTGARTLLHRDMWEFHNGAIPDGWDIHHRDENKMHNEITNFECLPKAEHTRLYSPHNNQYTRGRKRRQHSPYSQETKEAA